MHNAAFKAMDLPFHYGILEVSKAELSDAISWIRTGRLAGANLTIPHKQHAVSLVDRLGPVASVSGAVNTLVMEEGELVGYDTDGPGYLADLSRQQGFRPHGSRVVLLGAGGAARAVATALAQEGCASLVIAARRPDAATELAQHLAKDTETSARQLGHDRLWDSETAPTLVINATPCGLQQIEGTADWEDTQREIERWLPEGEAKTTLFSDLIYTPAHTPFLDAGATRSGKTHGGLGMLLHQGALGFTRWTGQEAPIQVMEEALKKALRDRISSSTN